MIDRHILLALGSVLTLLLASCGGGGGGDADAAQEPSIALTAAYETTQTVRASYPLKTVEVRGKAHGDLGRLNGKTIHVRLDGPGDLFVADIVPTLYPGTAEFGVNVPGATPTAAGRRTGTLRIDVCYDMECRQPLAGSPLLVPYDVTVLAGLSLATADVALGTTFGATPAMKDVAIGLPDGVTTWNVVYEVNEVGPDTLQAAGATKIAAAPPSQGIVRLQQFARPPGTYTDRFRVTATVDEGSMSYFYEQRLTVTSTVAPDAGIDAWLTPAPVAFSRVQGDAGILFAGYSLVPNEGISLGMASTEYLSQPDAAAGHAMTERWWMAYPSQAVSTCIDDGTVHCLPLGRYEARDVYTYVKNGQTKTFTVPLTLDVVTGP
jgi:hypothetical protein